MIEEKRMLRRTMRVLRREYPNRHVLDGMITEQFLKSEIYRDAEDLLLYASFDAEADTHALIKNALEDRKRVYLPRCVPHSNILQFYRIDSPDELVPDAFGISAPPAAEERLFSSAKNTVCVVPGLAFSEHGERLGYGKGYYDTFLEKIDVCTVGLCYSFQITKHIPTEPHDKRMRYLCTEQGVIRCGDPY